MSPGFDVDPRAVDAARCPPGRAPSLAWIRRALQARFQTSDRSRLAGCGSDGSGHPRLAGAERPPAQDQGMSRRRMAAGRPGVEPADRRGGRVRAGFPHAIGEQRKRRRRSRQRTAGVRGMADFPDSRQARLIVRRIPVAEPCDDHRDFRLGRRALIEPLIEPVDPGAVIRERLQVRVRGQFRRLPQDQRAVENPQRLLRHAGFHPFRAVMVRMRQVKGNQGRGQGITVHERIQAAAAVGGFGSSETERPPVVAGIERAGGGEQAVAHRFEIRAAAVPFPKPRVGLVDGLVFRRAVGRQAERARGQQQPVELLQRSAGLVEADRERVQQTAATPARFPAGRNLRDRRAARRNARPTRG